MVINALNSGADVFMADFEDANTPGWRNMVQGQVNLVDAVARTIEHTNPDGRVYRLHDVGATLLVRPRGWHLVERHCRVDGAPVSGSLFDFGLYVFHNGRRLLGGSGAYFLPAEAGKPPRGATLNDAFVLAEDRLGLTAARSAPPSWSRPSRPPSRWTRSSGSCGTTRAPSTPAAGLHVQPHQEVPDAIRSSCRRTELITMTVPFMRAYTELLVKTCHRRGAHAIGGMAAFIPNRRDPQVTEVALARVREDKLRESTDGFDGTWVAHPDLVAVAREPFAALLGARPHQLERQRPEVVADARALLDVRVPGGTVTEAGLRNNVTVALQYLAAWLGGTEAVAIFNLMEDAATAEISRSQIWQGPPQRPPGRGGPVTPALVRRIVEEELGKVRATLGVAGDPHGYYGVAREVFDAVALGDPFVDFLTLPASERIDL